MNGFSRCFVAAALLLLAGCYPVRDTSLPPATRLVTSRQAAQRVVIVLPGIADNLESLASGGIANVVAKHWPDADVILVEMTIGYYKSGQAMPDLHRIVQAAHQKGYGQVWLVGASLGGMGPCCTTRHIPAMSTASCCWLRTSVIEACSMRSGMQEG